MTPRKVLTEAEWITLDRENRAFERDHEDVHDGYEDDDDDAWDVPGSGPIKVTIVRLPDGTRHVSSELIEDE